MKKIVSISGGLDVADGIADAGRMRHETESEEPIRITKLMTATPIIRRMEI